MARSTTPADAIYARALTLLDEEGIAGINARRLAAELHCSTKTLYQQVGNQDQLIRELVARHFAALRLEFVEADTWQESAVRWCHSVRAALLAHPHLSALMTFDDREPIAAYVDRLLHVLLRAGVPAELARNCCRVLVHTTISLAGAEIAAGGESPDVFVEVFDNTIRWVVLGVSAEAT
ncbi:TetR/AcrR family transcriptional regulator [Mycolicibacterium komossense]|uniref:TetR/AcrR family transcriptional regulator C-terminal domain-containing protein n=1 Tax=Mycolicibacterium komossense TaxID=1779 RepID=A0ABT3CI25_9MYCO|nr:TetR/AcrR family transcriptional regulator C-terminal domain-containing protein [Mycolicibacterium komossense]MCV7229114.1 TetR/AcrR family transcriptional regulator C-terminal domain-containing protein [Mycolicibacterium komossense]